MHLNVEDRLQARKYDHVIFMQLVDKSIIQHELPYSYVKYEKMRETWKYLNIGHLSEQAKSKCVPELWKQEKPWTRNWLVF